MSLIFKHKSNRINYWVLLTLKLLLQYNGRAGGMTWYDFFSNSCMVNLEASATICSKLFVKLVQLLKSLIRVCVTKFLGLLEWLNFSRR